MSYDTYITAHPSTPDQIKAVFSKQTTEEAEEAVEEFEAGEETLGSHNGSADHKSISHCGAKTLIDVSKLPPGTKTIILETY